MPKFTQPFTLTTGVTHYGTSPPATAPIGWTVGYFEDFLSFNISGMSGQNPLATTNENPGKQWQLVPIPGTPNPLHATSEEQWYCAPQTSPAINPFSQSGSVLSITCQVQTNPTIQSNLNTTYTQNLFASFISQGMHGANTGDPPFSSGAINTSMFLVPQYGYFECNLKQPAGIGMWTAFWLHPQPIPSEFDIMESVGRMPTKSAMTAHYAPGASMIGNSSNNFNPDLGVNTTTGFHTYGGLWTPNYLAWYFDGNLVFQAPKTNGSDSFSDTATYVIINFACGTGIGDSRTQNSELPQTMQVDWFRYSVLGPQ